MDRRVAAGDPPEFPKCAKAKFPGRVAFDAWLVRVIAWVARWSVGLTKAIKTLKADWRGRVKTLLVALPERGDDIEFGDAVLPTLPDHILKFVANKYLELYFPANGRVA